MFMELLKERLLKLEKLAKDILSIISLRYNLYEKGHNIHVIREQ